MTQNRGDVTTYLPLDTSTQLKVMHTAENYKQKSEANIIYFRLKILPWWIIADLRNQHIRQGQSIAYRRFDLCGDRGWTVCPKLVLGGGEEESGIRKDYERELKNMGEKKKSFAPTGNENRSFCLKLHQFKMLWPRNNSYWPARSVDFVTYTKKWMDELASAPGAVVAGITMWTDLACHREKPVIPYHYVKTKL